MFKLKALAHHCFMSRRC